MLPTWRHRLAAAGAAAALGVVVGLVLVSGPLSDEEPAFTEPAAGRAAEDAETVTETPPPEDEGAVSPASPGEGEPQGSEIDRVHAAALAAAGGPGEITKLERKDDEEVAWEVKVEGADREVEMKLAHDLSVVELKRKMRRDDD